MLGVEDCCRKVFVKVRFLPFVLINVKEFEAEGVEMNDGWRHEPFV